MPVKRQKLSEMLKKQGLAKCGLQEPQLQIHRLSWVEVMHGKICHANSKHKGAMTILISAKTEYNGN